MIVNGRSTNYRYIITGSYFDILSQSPYMEWCLTEPQKQEPQVSFFFIDNHFDRLTSRSVISKNATDLSRPSVFSAMHSTLPGPEGYRFSSDLWAKTVSAVVLIYSSPCLRIQILFVFGGKKIN